jgi:branched-chain amino acid transport system permease protein
LNLETLIQSAIYGIFIGAVYGLAAAGLSLVFGVMDMLNVSHGELVMIGGYLTFWAFDLLKIDPFASLVLVLPAMFLIGVGLFLAFFYLLAKQPEEAKVKNSLLVGFGLTLVFHNLAILLWTTDERSVTTSYTALGLKFLGVSLPYTRLGGLILSLVLIGGLHLFLTRTYPGKAIRATAQNWQAATLMGIDIRRSYVLAFALGTVMAAAAGTMVVVSFAIEPAMGMSWTLKALIVVVMGGLGNVGGAFLAGIILGVVESISALFVGPYMQVVGLILFLLILQLRPQGLFGTR